MPGESRGNYTGSSTSCLETGTPGINTMRTITVSQITTTLTIRTEQYHDTTTPQYHIATNSNTNTRPQLYIELEPLTVQSFSNLGGLSNLTSN